MSGVHQRGGKGAAAVCQRELGLNGGRLQVQIVDSVQRNLRAAQDLPRGTGRPLAQDAASDGVEQQQKAGGSVDPLRVTGPGPCRADLHRREGGAGQPVDLCL